MNNRLKLAQASMITALAIVLLLLVVYVPFLGLLVFFVPVPYAIISAKSGFKYATMSMVVSFFILMLLTDPVYSIITTVINIFPGIIIGYKINENKTNKINFKPIYRGIITFAMSILILFGISKLMFNVNIIDTVLTQTEQVYNISNKISDGVSGYKIDQNYIKQMIEYIRLTIPSTLILYSIIATFIVYYITIFILKRTDKTTSQFPQFTKFYLPGNTVFMMAIMYCFALLLSNFMKSVNTHQVLVNLQLVFIYLLSIQGIAVFISFLKNLLKNKFARTTIFIFVFFFMSGLTAMGIIGVLDSIMDLRKIRTPKGN